MPHISKKKLGREVFLRIHKQFVAVVAELRTPVSVESFLGELLTTTEKIMLAKRLAIIFMLNEGVSEYYIYRTLKVSPSTVARMHVAFDGGKYKKIVRVLDGRKFWAQLGRFARMGMPPITGRGRWAWLDDLDAKYKYRTHK